MPKRRQIKPATIVEQELFDALERLKSATPKRPELRKKASIGMLRINPTTVALEAGRARTLIGHQNCAYPRVRAAIEAFKHDASTPATSFEEVNRRLRHENTDLRAAVIVAASRLAAMVRRMDSIERETRKQLAEAKRRAASVDAASNRPPHDAAPTKSGVVLPFKTIEDADPD